MLYLKHKIAFILPVTKSILNIRVKTSAITKSIQNRKNNSRLPVTKSTQNRKKQFYTSSHQKHSRQKNNFILPVTKSTQIIRVQTSAVNESMKGRDIFDLLGSRMNLISLNYLLFVRICAFQKPNKFEVNFILVIDLSCFK